MEQQNKIATHSKLAEKMYEPSDYKAKDDLSQGLAITHEQVSDTFVEGTIDAMIDNVQDTGEDARIPREGYQK